MKEENVKKEDKRIPVTIITGFLGSGKTTLLNRLIQQNVPKRLAVIENEFGETGIDGELVVGVEDGIFEMSSGCICCSLNDDLVNILTKILDRPKRPEHLLVETTGIADPGPVAMTFLADSHMQSIFRLDSIITLADARFIEQQLEEREEAIKQITAADIIIINKTDQVDLYQKETIANILKRINPEANIFYSIRGEVAGVNLLDQKAFAAEGIMKTRFEAPEEIKKSASYALKSASAEKPLSVLLKKDQIYKTLRHSDVSSHSFVFEMPLDVLRFDILMRTILNSKQYSLYRIKGILNLRGMPDKMIFQAVNNQYACESGGGWKETEDKSSRIVFIGKNISKEFLRRSLVLCLTDKPFDPKEFYESMEDIHRNFLT